MESNMVSIELVIDEKCVDPEVTIRAKEKSKQVEDIIYAIENVTENGFPMIPAYGDNGLVLLSQRDIIRVYVEDRKVMIQTEKGLYSVRKRLGGIEDELNPSRFIRISQSEIINIYKVKCFELNIAGTIGVVFENGSRSWASRSCVKAVRDILKT